MIEYKLIKSKRKSGTIRIDNDGSVLVNVPDYAKQDDIERFVQSQADWINNGQAVVMQAIAAREAFTLNYGDSISLCGLCYELVPRDSYQMGVEKGRVFIPEGLDNAQIKQAVIEFCHWGAKGVLTKKTMRIGERMGVIPTSVKISSAKKRWGSCSGKNRINLSWMLLFADEKVINYVIIHELAHIIHHNHSKFFWDCVEKYCPDYKECKVKLDEFQKKMFQEGWI